MSNEQLVWWKQRVLWGWLFLVVTIAVGIGFDTLSTFEGTQIFITLTLVLITWSSVKETAKMRADNSEMLKTTNLQYGRPYIVGLIKLGINPLKDRIRGLIDIYSERNINWNRPDEEQIKQNQVANEGLDVLKVGSEYYLPWYGYNIGEDISQNDYLSHYEYLITKHSNIGKLIASYDEEADKLWSKMRDMAIAIASSDIKNEVYQYVGTHKKALIAELEIPPERFSDFVDLVKEHCAYLAFCKLVMPQDTYYQIIENTGRNQALVELSKFWVRDGHRFIDKLENDDAIQGLIQEIVKSANDLKEKLVDIDNVLTRISKDYMAKYLIREEELFE
ncbi:MAG: hypothetical protein R6U37_07005 [Dehalococcoidia bacterium]